MPLMPWNPIGRVLIQLQPFTPPHDFSGRKLLQMKNLMSCSKSRTVPTLYWVTSQLLVIFFFKSIKQSKEDLKKKGGESQERY